MSNDWNIECSDDEFKDSKGPWEPSAETIERLYNNLEKGQLPEITWKCIGYKAPSPEVMDLPDDDPNNKEEADKSDFDFLDEASTPKLKMRKGGGDALKGSAKKKVTSLDGVLNNMRRHKLLTKDT